MRQIIYLEPTDNIATIRDRLQRAQANEVLLVLPPRYPTLRNLVNLKLLKRYAQSLAMDLALVVKDAETEVLAREVGLVLAPNVDKGRTIPLRRVSKKPVTQQPASIAMAGAGHLLERTRYSPAGASLLARSAALLLLLGLIAVLGAAFVYLVLPGATVVLVPATEPLQATSEIVAVPGLDGIQYEEGRVPAQTASVELVSSGSVPATGKRDIPDAHAEGKVVFANKTNGPVTVPKNTIVRTSSGATIRFYTVTDVELPATWGAHARVGIIAVDPGPQGNVKPLTINEVEGEIAFQVDVINDEPTTGGGLRRVSEVTAEDMGRLRNTLLQRLQQEALAKLQAQLSGNEFIPSETVSMEVVEQKYDRQPGDIADTLNLTLKVRAAGTVVGGEDANTLMLRLLERQLPEGYVLEPDSLRFSPGEVLVVEGPAVRFRMRASGMALCQIGSADVRRGIAGKLKEEALRYLLERWDFAAAPRLEITPDWLNRVPWIPYRIKVDMQAPGGR